MMKKFVRSWLFPLLSGFLLFLSFPKFGTGIVAWFALIPLFYALEGKTPSQSFKIGWITGLSFHLGLLYWIVHVVVHYGYLPFAMGVFALLALAAYLSLYIGLFAWGTAYFTGKGISVVWTAPILWIILEYGKSTLFTGFPWENLGYSQYLYLPLVQIADIAGVYGLSGVIVLVNVLLFRGFRPCLSWKNGLIHLFSVLFILSIIYTYGVWRIEQVRMVQRAGQPLPVTIIQGNMDQSVKWDPRYQKETVQIYTSLSRQEPKREGELIVWPETAAPFFFQELSGLQQDIMTMVRNRHSWLLLGSPSYSDRLGRQSLRNSAFLVSPETVIRGQYHKVHLVPYGEYVPLRSLFPFLSKIVVGVGDFEAGQGYIPLSLGDRLVGVLICYEGILPEAVRQYKNAGVQVLINITNDAWFGRTSAPYQHLSMAIFRSVESRLFLIRAANTGISAIIDPCGEILESTNLFQRTVLQGTVHSLTLPTVYAIIGDIGVGICAIALFIMIYLSLKKSKIRRLLP